MSVKYLVVLFLCMRGDKISGRNPARIRGWPRWEPVLLTRRRPPPDVNTWLVSNRAPSANVFVAARDEHLERWRSSPTLRRDSGHPQAVPPPTHARICSACSCYDKGGRSLHAYPMPSCYNKGLATVISQPFVAVICSICSRGGQAS